MRIRIANYVNVPLITVKEMSDFRSQTKLNDEGSLTFTIARELQGLAQNPIKCGYKVDALYLYDYGKYEYVFSGYISEINPTNAGITIIAKDWVEYMKHRLFRVGRSYATGTPVNTIIADVYSTVNSVFTLPFNLGLNDDTTTLTEPLIIAAGTTMFDAIQQIVGRSTGLQFRITRSFNQDPVFDISQNIGPLLNGIWRSNVNAQQNNTINSWGLNVSMEDYANSLYDQSTGVTENVPPGVMPYEKFNYPGNTTTVTADPISFPKISVDVQKEKWWDIKPGSQKKTLIITGTEWLDIQYIATVQGVSISSNSGSFSITLDIGVDMVGPQKNKLDKVLSRLGLLVNYLIKN